MSFRMCACLMRCLMPYMIVLFYVMFDAIHDLFCMYRELEEALEMGMDWSLREGKYKHSFLAICGSSGGWVDEQWVW